MHSKSHGNLELHVIVILCMVSSYSRKPKAAQTALFYAESYKRCVLPAPNRHRIGTDGLVT